MLIDEAYDRMVRGYLVKHESFGNGEYLWMNAQGIIYDENDNEFAENQFSQNDKMWETGWSIYKGKAKVKADRKDRMITNDNDTTFYDINYRERCPQLDGEIYEMYNQLGLDTMANPGNIGLIDKTSEDINTRVSMIAEKTGINKDKYDVIPYEKHIPSTSNNYNNGIRIPEGYSEIEMMKKMILKIKIVSSIFIILIVIIFLIFTII